MRTNSIYILFIAVLLLALPLSSQALDFNFRKNLDSVIEFLTPAQVSEEDIRECGNRIKSFKKFMLDLRQCNTSADCAHIRAKCPLTCNLFAHKIFKPAIEKEIDYVLDICEDAIQNCNKCFPYQARPICKNGVCKAG